MIKNSSKQAGSAHVIIVIVLLIVVLGALGFVFWNNFIKKDNSASTDTNKSADIKKNEVESNDTLQFSDNTLGIEFTYPKDWIKVDCHDANMENSSQYNIYFGTSNEGLGIVNGNSGPLCGGGSDFAPQMAFSVRKDIEDEELHLDYAESSSEVTVDGVYAKKWVSRTDSHSVVPDLESTTYVIKKLDGMYFTATYNRFPKITNSSRDNSEAGLQAFVNLVEKSLHFLKTSKQVE